LTIVVVLFSNLLITLFDIFSYAYEFKSPERPILPKISKLEWFFRVLFTCLLIGTVFRYYEALKHGYIYRKKYHNTINDKKVLKLIQHYFYILLTAIWMRVMECWLESAPQLILQLSILIDESKNLDKLYSASK